MSSWQITQPTGTRRGPQVMSGGGGIDGVAVPHWVFNPWQRRTAAPIAQRKPGTEGPLAWGSCPQPPFWQQTLDVPSGQAMPAAWQCGQSGDAATGDTAGARPGEEQQQLPHTFALLGQPQAPVRQRLEGPPLSALAGRGKPIAPAR